MPVSSGTYRRYITGIDCPDCQMTVVGLWVDVGPNKLRLCEECHRSWELSVMHHPSTDQERFRPKGEG